MSTVERVKMISTGSLSPGCGGTADVWDLALTDDFAFFFGHRFIGTCAGLTAVVVLWRREPAAVTCCLELLDVALTAVVEEHVCVDMLLLALQCPSDGCLDAACKLSTLPYSYKLFLSIYTPIYISNCSSSLSHLGPYAWHCLKC